MFYILHRGITDTCKNDNGESCGEDERLSLWRKTSTLPQTSSVQTFPLVTIPTILTQTFPSVTIPTALTSTISFSTASLGPTSVLISFPAISPFQPTIPFTSFPASSINFFSTSTSVPIFSTLSTARPTASSFTSSTNGSSPMQTNTIPTASTSSVNPSATAAGNASGTSSTSKPRLSPGGIAGIVIAVFVGILILALLIFFFWKQFRSRNRNSSGHSNSLYEKQLISPISSPFDRRGTFFTPMVIAPTQPPDYPSGRPSIEVLQRNSDSWPGAAPRVEGIGVA
ncbi:uncharacterized protein K444DRAFT_322184 [Hyaloscypha bicolor E]|uniref:Mid2 domain-containing protein n=1 Tax=Hyaloscypha bicolor E TaxID=1095630 RepID=A0A2J6TKJ5_9HELO|nr:uncharacterized protein K444DRAFT_322184 [Hyaloscypha bicolor E]PMD63508.1 hypothetical protein K444DRAFT_322184 [Hyaloscypha bicolor E]